MQNGPETRSQTERRQPTNIAANQQVLSLRASPKNPGITTCERRRWERGTIAYHWFFSDRKDSPKIAHPYAKSAAKKEPLPSILTHTLIWSSGEVVHNCVISFIVL